MLQLAREMAAGGPGANAARGGSGGGREDRPPYPCHLVDVAVDSGRDLLLSFSDCSKRTLQGCQVGRSST